MAELQRRNYKILQRNFRARYGEIDIVAEHDNCLVFVEVKTRFSSDFGAPEQAVNGRKVREIKFVGDYYRLLHPESPPLMRIDVTAIELNSDWSVKRLKIIRNITG